MSTLPLNDAPSAIVQRDALTSPMRRPPAIRSTRSLAVTLPVIWPPTESERTTVDFSTGSRLEVAQDLTWALMNSPAFLFNH